MAHRPDASVMALVGVRIPDSSSSAFGMSPKTWRLPDLAPGDALLRTLDSLVAEPHATTRPEYGVRRCPARQVLQPLRQASFSQ